MKMVVCALILTLIMRVNGAPVQPAVFTTWHYQINNDVLAISNALSKDVYVFDMWTIDPTTVSTIKAKPALVFCTFSAGIWENWRPDANNFPTISHTNNVPGTTNQ